jgi:hypothetical protein
MIFFVNCTPGPPEAEVKQGVVEELFSSLSNKLRKTKIEERTAGRMVRVYICELGGKMCWEDNVQMPASAPNILSSGLTPQGIRNPR